MRAPRRALERGAVSASGSGGGHRPPGPTSFPRRPPAPGRPLRVCPSGGTGGDPSSTPGAAPRLTPAGAPAPPTTAAVGAPRSRPLTTAQQLLDRGPSSEGDEPPGAASVRQSLKDGWLLRAPGRRHVRRRFRGPPSAGSTEGRPQRRAPGACPGRGLPGPCRPSADGTTATTKNGSCVCGIQSPPSSPQPPHGPL